MHLRTVTFSKTTMSVLLQKLAGGDRRSIGKSEEVVALVLADPKRLSAVFDGMLSGDPLLQMRCADVVEKVTAQRPELLAPFKARLLKQVAGLKQQEVRWHAAQMFSRLDLNKRERRTVFKKLTEYLTDESRIVKTFAMQALADIAERDEELRPEIIKQLKRMTRAGSPAMKSRGKKLLAKLDPA